MQKASEILSEIKRAVLSIDESAKVILFGSRARGDYHEESDWDVLVLVDKEVNDIFRLEVIDVLLDLELKYQIGINAIIRDNQKWNKLEKSDLYVNVRQEGQLL